jgi:transposase-like protein
MKKKHTPLHGIEVVQYNLFDFMEGTPKPVDTVIRERLSRNTRRIHLPQVALLDRDHVGNVTPLCPHCGATTSVKNGFYPRRLRLGVYGDITIHVQRYICKKCGTHFSAALSGLVEKGHQYAALFRQLVNAISSIMQYSSRKVRQVLLALFGVSPSHQTLETWMRAEIPELKRSGYYCYDEQYIRLNGEKGYRLTLFDTVLNVPVAERIAEKITPEGVMKFLTESAGDTPIHAVTTDDRTLYRPVMEKIGCIHQLCAFHYLRNVRKEASWYFEKKSLSEREKMDLALCVSLMHEIFRSSTFEEAQERLYEVYNMVDSVPSRIKKQIKKLIEDFPLYTAYLDDPRIKKTTSKVEEYYRQTDPQKIKKQYKTRKGLEQALHQKAVYWVVRHGFISQEYSLELARKYLGNHYDNQNITRVFSKKKKHVLTYWMR